MKTCNHCNETKDEKDFYNDKASADGKYTLCKKCKHEKTYSWRERNREKYNAGIRAYNAKNYHRLRLNRYDLSVEDHAAMLAAQKGVCALCDRPPNGRRPLCVDHCHESGKVRGLLCYGCNRLMVLLDNPELLAKAQAYKKKYG